MSEGSDRQGLRALVLPTSPLTEEAFAPYGRVLAPGARVALPAIARGVASVELWQPSGFCTSRLRRFPSTPRAVVPLSGAGLVVLVLGRGEEGEGRLQAFYAAPGQGLMLGAGVWHAGPVALEEGSVLELVDQPGGAEAVEVAGLAELAGVDLVTVELPGTEGETPPPVARGALGSVDLSPNAQGRMAAGLLWLEGLRIGRPADELVRACADARGRQAASGDPALRDNLHAASLLVSANRGLRILAVDADLLQPPLRLRLGEPKERIRDEDGRRSSVRGEPVLCDGNGIAGSARAAARWALPTPSTACALVSVFLDPSLPLGPARDHLDAVSQTLRDATQGREAARVLVGLPAPGAR